MRSRINNNNKNRVSNVRIVDPLAGTDGTKVDRMISQVHSTESQTRILCQVGNPIQSTNADSNLQLNFATLATTDDFISFSQQFNMFRVVAARLELYDINPANPVSSVVGSYHSDGVLPSPVAFSQTMDLPDAQSISAGGNKISLTWTSKGTLENTFQAVNSFIDYGGFVVSLAANGATASPKFLYTLKFVVDFRGRR